MMQAVRRRSLGLVFLLLLLFVVPKTCSVLDPSSSSTPLMTSVSANDTAGVRRLLEEGADPNQWVLGTTPLMETARQGNREIVEILLAAGARPQLTGDNGWTPLMSVAVKSGDLEIAKVLVRAGARVCSRTDILEFDNALASEVAARSGHQPLAEILRQAEGPCKRER